MKGVFINCPSKECRKMLMKNVYLRPGSYLTAKCFHCGVMVNVEAQQGQIQLSMDKTSEKELFVHVDKSGLTDEDDDGMIFLSV